jgi:predicted Zn-dependent peptidase
VLPYPGAATWFEFADVTTKDTAAALKEVLHEVELLRKEPPPAEELAGMQRYMSGTFVLGNSNRAGIISQLRFIDLYGLPDDWLRTYVQKVNAVTPEEVTRITRKYIDPTRMTLSVAGDRKAVEGDLGQFGTLKLVVPPSR